MLRVVRVGLPDFRPYDVGEQGFHQRSTSKVNVGAVKQGQRGVYVAALRAGSTP